MKLLERRRLIHTLLLASILLNVLMIGYLANSGGLRRALVRLDLLPLSSARQKFQEEDEVRFRKIPGALGGVFFAGESHAAAGPWADFYSQVHNRGIGGETTLGLLKRLDEITARKPAKLFLMLGSNDLASASTPSRVVANYREILGRLRSEIPATRVYVLSILPVNRDFKERAMFTSSDVREVNRGLEVAVAEFPNARFVDLTELVADASGNLRPDYTNDGLHLTVEGYLAIRERLDPLVAEDAGTPARVEVKAR